MLAVTDPHHLPVSHTTHPHGGIRAVKGGRGENKKKDFSIQQSGHSEAKNGNNNNNNNKRACSCGVFPSPSPYTRGGYFSRRVAERSPVCDISLQSHLGTVHKVEGLRKFGIPVLLGEERTRTPGPQGRPSGVTHPVGVGPPSFPNNILIVRGPPNSSVGHGTLATAAGKPSPMPGR